LSGAVLGAALVLPTTLLAAQPPPAPNGPGAPAAAGEQPSPPPSPTLPPAPPTDPPADSAQPPPDRRTRDVAERDRRGSGGGDPTRRSTLASGSAAAKAGSVSIVGDTFSSFAFRPKSITVHTGDRVRWVNNSGAPEGHNVNGDGGLNSEIFFEGESYSHTFSRAGKYSYICTLHPAMKGNVVVKGSSGSGGGSQSSGGGGGDSSGSDSASGGTGGSGFAGGSSGVDPGGSGSLPATGLPLIGLGLAGLGLVVGGLLLRRWVDYGWYY
jgi:plastocyanin